MNINELITEVYRNVERRGYIRGYDDNQLIIRQVLKLQEEVGELAREVFDNNQRMFDYGSVMKIDTDEIADVFIVLSVLCAVLGIDLETVVIRKVIDDVERGVRESGRC